MLSYNKKKLIIILIYMSFFIIIPIIKNESRLIEKKIVRYESQIFLLEKNLLEASLEYQYLTSSAVLSSKIENHFDQKYTNLDFSQIYLDIDDFISEQKKITRILTNEK
jgi:hypothetical protein